MGLTGRWKEIFEQESGKEYFLELKSRIKKDRDSSEVYPDGKDVFAALKLTPYEKVRVVIVGDEPYHDKNISGGLAFSSQDEFNSPELQIIFDELVRSYVETPWRGKRGGDLTKWAEQGVLLLNRRLTVKKGEKESHKDIGWETFIDVIIDELIKKEFVVWMLWGEEAKALIKGKKSEKGKHFALKSHSPKEQLRNITNGFVGNNHFVRCNELLIKHDMTPISWDTNKDSPINFESYSDYIKWKELNDSSIFYFEPPQQRFKMKYGVNTRMDLILHPL